jgi:tetratricopeptide (TPR) repeat protein
MAAQWAQFAGWLSASAGDPDTARRWYARALEWAAEVGNTDMISTLLNLRGHLEWQAGRVGPMIGLSAAAQQQAATPGVKALAAQQEARGHALTGDTEAAERKLAEAVALTEAAAANPDGSPPWVYFHSSEYLTLQRGLAYHLLGDEEAAVELLTAGLAALPASVRRTEWTAWYVYRLALAHSRLGNRDRAEAALAEVAGMAEQTGSVRLRAAAERLARHLGL